jgi:hypothetical protein
MFFFREGSMSNAVELGVFAQDEIRRVAKGFSTLIQICMLRWERIVLPTADWTKEAHTILIPF